VFHQRWCQSGDNPEKYATTLSREQGEDLKYPERLWPMSTPEQDRRFIARLV
jgi:hypothetical protein